MVPVGQRGGVVFACKGDALTRRPAEQQRLFSCREQSLTAPFGSRRSPALAGVRLSPRLS